MLIAKWNRVTVSPVAVQVWYHKLWGPSEGARVPVAYMLEDMAISNPNLRAKSNQINRDRQSSMRSAASVLQ